MMMIVSMFTSRIAFGLAYASVHLPAGSLAAGEGVGNLVHGVLRRTLRVVGATFVLQAPVSGHRAGGFLGATFTLSVFLLVMNPPIGWVVTSARPGASGAS
jgi:hypothetical protein